MLKPVEGVSLRTYGRIVARMAGGGEELDAILPS